MRCRLSFTLGWLMFAVAVLALVLGGEETRRRRAHYIQIALRHEEAEYFQRFLLGGGTAVVGYDTGGVVTYMGPKTELVAMPGGYTGYIQSIPSEPELQPEYLARRADFHARLRQKYERAASRPWLAVEPDPPPPAPIPSCINCAGG
jgi:hypothetical protein